MARGLLQRAFAVALQRPGLAVPTLVADLLASGLQWMRVAGLMALTSAQLKHLFSRAPAQYSGTPTSIRLVWVFGGVARLGANFLALLLYTGALLATTAIFRVGSSGQPFAVGVAAVKSSMTAALVFCLKLFALLAAVNLLLTLIYAAGENRLFVATTDIEVMFSAIALAGVAFAMSPSAYRLVETHGATPLRKDDAGSLRWAAAACVAGSGLVYLACTMLKGRFVPVYESYSVEVAESIGISLISALPYALLFIAFALLSSAAGPETMRAEPYSRTEEPS